MASLIVANFLINCYEKEIDAFPAEMQRYTDTWQAFDSFFNIAFLIEIILNMWSNGGPYKKFWNSGWNIFDFMVVAIGLIFMADLLPAHNPLSNLKMLRAFRVFRLFKRIKSLNKIVMALLNAIPGVINAFIVMIIFMMIYSILAVEYFSILGQGFPDSPNGAPYGTYITYGDMLENRELRVEETHVINARTERGFTYGWEYFGTFTKALFTLFQVMTGEGWSENVARPLMFGLSRQAIGTSIFFVTFILLTNVVLTNVVVAVLLDKFETDADDGSADGAPADAPDAAAPPNGAEGKPKVLSDVEIAEMLGSGDMPAECASMMSTPTSASPDKRRARLPQATALPSPAYGVNDAVDALWARLNLEDDYAAGGGGGGGGFVTLNDIDAKLNVLVDAVASLQAGLDEVRANQWSAASRDDGMSA